MKSHILTIWTVSRDHGIKLAWSRDEPQWRCYEGKVRKWKCRKYVTSGAHSVEISAEDTLKVRLTGSPERSSTIRSTQMEEAWSESWLERLSLSLVVSVSVSIRTWWYRFFSHRWNLYLFPDKRIAICHLFDPSVWLAVVIRGIATEPPRNGSYMHSLRSTVTSLRFYLCIIHSLNTSKVT